MMTVGGCVAAFWLLLAIMPEGFCVPAYDPPERDLTIIAPVDVIEPFRCAQEALPARAEGVTTPSAIDAASAPMLRPD